MSFTVAEGEIFGYLGRTAGQDLDDQMRPGPDFSDAGTISLFGRSPLDSRARRSWAFSAENPYFYDYLTAREFLDFYRPAFPDSPAERAGGSPAFSIGWTWKQAADVPLRNFPGACSKHRPGPGLDQRSGVRDPGRAARRPRSPRPQGDRDIILGLREEGEKRFCHPPTFSRTSR